MRTTRALVVAAATAAAVGLAAPTASAWDQPSGVTAAPSVIAPGGQLVLTVDGSAGPQQVVEDAVAKWRDVDACP